MLKSKKYVKEHEWIETFENIEKYVTKKHIDDLTRKTKDEIKQRIGRKKAAVSWSAGKDSIVLGALCSDISNWFIALSRLEYPDFEKWLNENSPKQLEKVYVELDLKWLSKNREMLFPNDSKILGKWYRIIQHKIQREYCKKNGIEIVLLGRRKKDGNYIGKDKEYTKNGVIYYTPIAEWTHEEVFGFLHYNGCALPKIYDYPDGYKNGTHVWPSRAMKTNKIETWREIYDIDKNIVFEAKDYFEEAQKVWEEK